MVGTQVCEVCKTLLGADEHRTECSQCQRMFGPCCYLQSELCKSCDTRDWLQIAKDTFPEWTLEKWKDETFTFTGWPVHSAMVEEDGKTIEDAVHSAVQKLTERIRREKS